VSDVSLPPEPVHQVEVDLAAFLPDGVALGEPDAADDVDTVDEGVINGSDTPDTPDTPDTDEAPTVVDPAVVDPAVVDSDVAAAPEVEPEPDAVVDVEALRQIERDLDAVDTAIAALDAGTYGIDPATGAPIDDALLAENPTRLS